LPHADLSTEECLAELSPSEDAAACQSCGAHTGTNPTDQLMFVNEYALLYKGLLIRQSRHCSLATINGDGELHRIRLSGSDRTRCTANEMFDETNEDIVYFPEQPSDGPTTSSAGVTRLPSFACYKFNRSEIAKNLSPNEAGWVKRARISKRGIFIPTATGDAAAMGAAKALLQAAAAARWVDPATANVDVSLIVLSVEYGMVTEITLSCNFHLGGHIETNFHMRSMSPSMLTPVYGWTTRWEP